MNQNKITPTESWSGKQKSHLNKAKGFDCITFNKKEQLIFLKRIEKKDWNYFWLKSS